MTKAQFFLIELAIVAVATVLIVLSYYVVLPFFFPGTATYSVMAGGVLLASLWGALTAKRYGRSVKRTMWITHVGIGLVVGFLVLFLSLAALVNLIGE